MPVVLCANFRLKTTEFCLECTLYYEDKPLIFTERLHCEAPSWTEDIRDAS